MYETRTGKNNDGGEERSKLADMAYITGEAREQVTMFPVTLDELIPASICAG